LRAVGGGVKRLSYRPLPLPPGDGAGDDERDTDGVDAGETEADRGAPGWARLLPKLDAA
jgi:hypothetical protein